MRHRRYPIKKSVKIKASDPLTKGKGAAKVDLKKKNRAPTLDELDQQFVPKRLQEIEKAKEADQNKRKKKGKANKNKFLALTSQMGFHQRPWESQEMLVKRVMTSKNKDLDDEMIKVKAGTAGRDVHDLEEDFNKLEEADKRKKLAKVALREKRKKQMEKEKQFKESKIGKQAGDSDVDMDFSGSEPESEEDGEEEEVSAETKKPKKKEKNLVSQKKRRLNQKERKNLKKRLVDEERQKDFMLHAKEIIPFGETVDAPPKFNAAFRKTMDPLTAQAGKKDLLLKKLLSNPVPQKTNGVVETSEDNVGKSSKNSQKIDEQDRLDVIAAYRNLRKNKNH